MKIQRVHVNESVYVGPTEPYDILPPLDVLESDRVKEWSFEEQSDGSILVTHKNPRAYSIQTPHGQAFVTRIGGGNLRCVQYESAPLPAPAAKLKGAA